MLLFVLHLIILALCLILRVVDVDDAFIGKFFVIASSLAIIAYIINIKGLSRSVKLIVIAGFVFRMVLVFVDVFVTRLPDAGTDDDGFYEFSARIYENGYSGFFQDVYGGVFTKLLSVAYFFIGASRFSAQYLNVLLFAITAVVLIKALKNFKVSDKSLLVCVSLLCLMPNSMLMNSILRRETIMELCICVSIFYLSKWRNDPRFFYMIMVVLTMAISSLFHTALIFGALIMSLYFALYDKKRREVSFSISKMSKMAVLSVCVVFALIGFLSMWNNKLTSVSSMDDVYTAAMRARGGSVYLEGYTINNFVDLILFTPLKLFYFIFSPVPWKFRGLMDVISFVIDTLICIVLLYKTVRMKKDSVSRLLLVLFILLASVFALGTFNSGTAIRHRFSLLPFLLVSYSIAETMRENNRKIAESGESKFGSLNKRRKV